MVTGSSELSTKRKLLEKQGRLLKKPKTVLELIMRLKSEGRKTITPTKHGAGKGLITGPSTTQEKPPVLLREDSKYALEKLLSILMSEDYEDLSNHLCCPSITCSSIYFSFHPFTFVTNPLYF